MSANKRGHIPMVFSAPVDEAEKRPVMMRFAREKDVPDTSNPIGRQGVAESLGDGVEGWDLSAPGTARNPEPS